ncbi:haloacid dehalogenase [Amycolatopsis antarctica]|uniref:Haloacid dehalogenase n=1 Tax=Amycolatopsis antarctica TaxID=1854586 RepID=A0A263D2H1_9PSEU|nr:haloacid dehalogenase [Amycolatopsis antarctica]
MPREVARTRDPFDVLRYAVSCGPDTAHVVERQLRRHELEAVTLVREKPDVRGALRRLTDAGITVTVFGNLAVDAVSSFLSLRDLAEDAKWVSARASGDPARLTPDPFLLHQAIHALGSSAERCLVVAESAADLAAAAAAGIDAVTSLRDPAATPAPASRWPPDR